MHIHAILLICYVLAVAAIDFRTHRIPNALTLSGLIASLSLALAQDGSPDVLESVSGLGVGLALFVPFYAVRAFGAGDVKAMAVVGSFLGWKGAALASAATLIAGGVIALGVLIVSTRSARVALHRIVGTLGAPLATARASENGKPVQRFPYGLAIAIGTIASLLIVDPIAG